MQMRTQRPPAKVEGQQVVGATLVAALGKDGGASTISTNDPGMFMQTNDRYESQPPPDPSLPKEGSFAATLRRSALRDLREQSENVYENKGSWAGADIAFECLRCAEGAGRTIYDDCPEPVPSGHRRVEKPGWRIRPAVLWRDVCAFWTAVQTCPTTARLRHPRVFFMGFRGPKAMGTDPTNRGLRQPELAGREQDFDGTKPECL